MDYFKVEYLAYYLIGINVVTYLFFGIDKAKATKKKWRIPEKYLFLFTFLGGTIGAIVGMKQFHHKTQKSEFKNVIFIIVIVQIAILSFLGWHFYREA